MMTDRELLTLAAKAAGVGPLDFDYAEREGHGMYFGPRLPMPQGVLMAAMWTYWRPLEDDSDALRLAVKLRMDLLLNDELLRYSLPAPGKGQHIIFWGAGREDKECLTVNDAIVRAAAAIGESML